MVAEVTEQPVAVEDQEPVTEEQPIEAVAEVEETPEAVETTPVVADPTPTFDLSTPEGIRAAAEQFPSLQQWREEGFNAGRMKRDKELRLEKGTSETAQAYHQWVAEQIANGVDPKELGKQTPLYVTANRDAERVEIAKTFATKALDGFGLDDEMRSTITEQLEALSDDPARLETVATQLWEQGTARVTDSAVNERVGNLTLEDIPKDSRLHAALQAHIESEVAKEIEARAAEKEPVANPPRTPRGAVSGGYTRDQIEKMTPQEINANWNEIAPHLADITAAGASA